MNRGGFERESEFGYREYMELNTAENTWKHGTKRKTITGKGSGVVRPASLSHKLHKNTHPQDSDICMICQIEFLLHCLWKSVPICVVQVYIKWLHTSQHSQTNPTRGDGTNVHALNIV